MTATHGVVVCLVPVVKYGIDRDDIVLGRILGEGFFGEVYEGMYKKSASLSPDILLTQSILTPQMGLTNHNIDLTVCVVCVSGLCVCEPEWGEAKCGGEDL